MSLLDRPRRRDLLKTVGGLCVGGPLGALLPRYASAAGGVAERVIFFYFPDGVAGSSQNGDPSKWHATGSETSFSLPEQTAPLEPWRDECVFFRGLSMGGTDAGSHPGGAQKLLTARDHGNGESIDQYLSRTVGSSSPWRHLYLGVQANADGASGDKHITYPTAGVPIPPEDDPRRAFELLFGTAPGGSPGTSPGTATGPAPDPVQGSVIDTVMEDLASLRARLGTLESAKLDLHLDALRQMEQRIGGLPPTGGVDDASCDEPSVDMTGVSDGGLYAPESFGDLLRAQMDLMVLAMACGMTRVGTIQASHHTSELIMSRIPGTSFHDPGFDMRSHQASHYGASHDPGNDLYTAFSAQRAWWAEQFGALIGRLAAIPEGDGTMLDHSVLVLCTEVCDGNTHSHDDMPFVLAGRAGGRISTGRLLDRGYRRHGDLWASVAHAMGDPIAGFGDGSSGPFPDLVR